MKKSGEKQEIRRYGYKAIASAPSLSTSQQNTLHAHARKKRQLSWPLAPYETSTNLARVPYQKTTMSDRREVQTKPLIILRNAEDYPKWKSHITSKLQQQNCEWAITERATPNLESVKANLIEDGFAREDLRPSTLVSALRDEKKD